MFGKGKKTGAKRAPKSVSLRFERRAKGIQIALFGLGFLVMVGVLFRLQILVGADLQKQAVDQQLKDVTLSAKRGTIYDQKMKPLAESVSVWTVSIDPRNLRDANKNIKEADREEVAKRLSQILEMDYQKVYDICGKNTQYEKVKENIDIYVKDKIVALVKELSSKKQRSPIKGVIYLTPSYKRFYLYNDFASSVLGYVGRDSEGQGGLEGQYDRQLTGLPGRLIAAKNAVGKDMPEEYERWIKADDGCDLILTIDEVIQHYVEKNLETAIKTNKVKERACAIMMNVKTGEILAMAVKDGFDPNNSRQIFNEEVRAALEAMPEGTEEEKKAKNDATLAAQFDQWRNKAISDTYEPGSVYKIITAAMGIEESIVSADSGHFVCNGSYQVKDRIIRCHKAEGHGVQTFSDIMRNSCNPGFIQLGQSIGVERFSKYFEAFGLTEKTGIDLPGEMGNKGLYHTREKMGIVELSSSSFGQSFGVTPIQMITAIAAATNGGYLVEPHLVKQIVDGEGNIVQTSGTKVKRQVISKETSQKLCEVLESVVSLGTGKNAYVEGYKVAGKTGTSEKLNSKDKEARIASFCGIAPSEDPQVALLLLFDEPNGTSKYGSVVAAPVFSKIMSEVLPYLGVEKSYTEEELRNLAVTTPRLENLSPADATKETDKAGLKIRVLGSGGKIIRQIPVAGQKIPKGGKVVVYTDSNSAKSTIAVPDFSGKTLSEANALAGEFDLNLSLAGAALKGGGMVCNGQNIAPGTKVARGTVIKLDFVAPDQVE